jgi:hypothetical protein
MAFNNPFKKKTVKTAKPKKIEKVREEVVEIHNCSTCSGEGLVKKGLVLKVCTVCAGTGK